MSCLVQLPPSTLNVFNDCTSQGKGQTLKREKETQSRKDSRRNIKSPFRKQPRRKQFIHSSNPSKRIRESRNNSGILSSQFILCIWWFTLIIMLACDKNCNLFSIPTVEGRPYYWHNMCTVVATITKLDYYVTVGLQDFGKPYDNVPDSYSPYLTVLPSSFKDLCQLPDEKDYESMEFPPGKIATMVDLDNGDCDILTKAHNALLLQKDVIKDLEYVIFYKSQDRNMNEVPELSLDYTMPPTMPPIMPPTPQPTTPQPTLDQPTLNPTRHPTLAPTLSPTPDGTLAPSTTGMPSMSPSSTPSLSISSSPSDGPSLSLKPTISPIPSQDPSQAQSSLPISLVPSSDSTATQTVQYTETATTSTSETATTSTSTLFPTDDPSSYTYTREDKKKEVEENDSMVFLSLSMGDSLAIMAGIYRSEYWVQTTPELSKPGNKNWDMKMKFFVALTAPSCPDSGRYTKRTSKPTWTPSIHPTPSPKNQPSTLYQDNAPGTFTIFKFIFFALLIVSPCLRLLHLWSAGGGRIRFRRSIDDNSNRIVGLQYIPPMDNWFGSPLESNETPRPPDRLTFQQIMSLPEIRYTKPIHSDEKRSTIETIEEEDDSTGSNISHNREHLHNETNDTDTTGTPTINNETAVGEEGELDDDESVVLSEASFENEPSVRLELPTSPLRVSSTSIFQTSNPLSPRAILVHTEEVPPDEESPEEQDQQEEQPNLHQPPLSPSTPTPTLTQEQQQQEAQPQQSMTQQQEQEQLVEGEEAAPLSFRTQRRMQNFTTTTCTTCSICIDEFEEGETIRLLPRCGHAFHTSCILPWLQDRQGCCPLCKMDVLDRSSDEVDNNNRETTRAEF